MKMTVITPKSAPLDIDAEKIFFPGIIGSFEVLRGHAPIIAALGKGEIRWEGGESGSGSFAISSGMVELKDNVISAAVEQ